MTTKFQGVCKSLGFREATASKAYSAWKISAWTTFASQKEALWLPAEREAPRSKTWWFLRRTALSDIIARDRARAQFTARYPSRYSFRMLRRRPLKASFLRLSGFSKPRQRDRTRRMPHSFKKRHPSTRRSPMKNCAPCPSIIKEKAWCWAQTIPQRRRRRKRATIH